MGWSIAVALVAAAGASGAEPRPGPFAPLLADGAEWVYTLYAEDAAGKRSPLETPGELRLRVVLVREVGDTTLVALAPVLDGVEAARLVGDMDLVAPFPVDPIVIAVSADGLRAVDLSLDDARSATSEAVARATAECTYALAFPAKPKAGWRHRWKFDDAQQNYEAEGRLSLGHERVRGSRVEAWVMTWKGRACFAGTCVPYAATHVFSPAAGLVRFCRLDLYAKPPVHCLGMVERADAAEHAVAGAPSNGEVWRVLQQVRPAVLACMRSESDISTLTFHIEPDGSLTHLRERNLSGETARCTAAAARDVRFPPFAGPPKVVERFSFSKS
jgi:hypothetical protein